MFPFFTNPTTAPTFSLGAFPNRLLDSLRNVIPSVSARRLAAFFHRVDGDWVASPSLAFLSALLAGKARPKRVLVPEGAPAFVSNVSRISGALPIQVGPGGPGPVLRDLIRKEGLGADEVWAVAVHRDGLLASPEWLPACLPYGVPTVELCLGSLAPLARRAGPAPTFTIVSLDAEPTLAAVHLTALLTSDAAITRRVRQLCLPGPESMDYVLDATPRGVGHDEKDLLALIDRILGSAGAELAPGPVGDAQDRPSAPFSLSWNRRFREEAKGGEEAKARHEEESRVAAATIEALRKRVAELQSAVDQLVPRSENAEREGSERAAQIDRLREDLQRAQETQAVQVAQKVEVEEKLKSVQEETKERANDLRRAEAERSAAEASAAERARALEASLGEERRRVADLEQSAAVLTGREAENAAKWETSRAELSAQVDRLKEEQLRAEEAHARLAARNTELEDGLKSAQEETKERAKDLRRVESERDAVVAKAAESARALEALLEEQRRRVADLERSAAALTGREVESSSKWEASRAEFSRQIGQLNEELRAAEGARTKLQTQQVDLDERLKLAQAEGRARAKDLGRVERELKRALAEVAEGGAVSASLRTRVAESERDLAAAAARLSDAESRGRKLDEARQKQHEAEMAGATEGWKARLESAELAKASLETALAARAAEASAHQSAFEMWRAHRATLFERIEELRAGTRALTTAAESTPPVEAEVATQDTAPTGNGEPEPAFRPRERAPAPWEVQPPRHAISLTESDSRSGEAYEEFRLPTTGFTNEPPAAGFLPPSPSAQIPDLPGPSFSPEYDQGALEREPGEETPRPWLRGLKDRIRLP